MTQQIGSSKDVFHTLYKSSHERSSNPNLYNPRLSLKGRVITLILYITVLVLSFMYPVSGIVFYGIFRDDRPMHAITGLVIFLANFIFAISAHIIRVIQYA